MTILSFNAFHSHIIDTLYIYSVYIKSLGYKWFDIGDYNLNIVGVRNMEAGERVTNKFDDWITISYQFADSDWDRCYKDETFLAA